VTWIRRSPVRKRAHSVCCRPRQAGANALTAGLIVVSFVACTVCLVARSGHHNQEESEAVKVLDRVSNDLQGMQVYQKFIDRYEKGAPWEGYTDLEVQGRYQALIPLLSPEQFVWAAEQSLERFSPQNRMLFGQYIQQQAQEVGLRIPELEEEDAAANLRDCSVLARILADLQQRRPDMPANLLSCREGILNSLLLKAALAGITAYGAKTHIREKREGWHTGMVDRMVPSEAAG
jgi:hypothetical protein